MSQSLLLKGFEVELFTGRANGQHVGVAAPLTKDLPEFVKEPDHRNLEYITVPKFEYCELIEELLEPRRKLRQWLASRDLTLLPGSTLSLGDSAFFQRSDPSNKYHDFIEAKYGTSVVTASIHINFGIDDLASLFSALRLVRCEAALILSMSASSPFLDGRLTGFHSQRWHQFPLTPENVPLFLDHRHYVGWVEDHLRTGKMRNERHLWTSVRPNGPERPYKLNRLELRICDLITDPSMLLAVTAFLELRVLTLLQNPETHDPLMVSRLSMQDLALLNDKNDAIAAQESLDATLFHWKDGSPISCREWIEEMLVSVAPLANELGLAHRLMPLRNLLSDGNQAIQWLGAYSSGKTVQEIIQEGIAKMNSEEIPISKKEALLG